MATFTDNPSYIFTEIIGHRTNILTMEDGGEQRNSYGTARRIFSLNFDRVTETVRDSILAFYDARTGRFGTFDWVNPNDNVTYTVRFVPESLEIEEIDFEMWNISLQFIEII